MTDEPVRIRRNRPDSPLRERRLDLRMLQREVAQRAGCAESLISMAESGYVPKVDTQVRIADALAASVGAFWPEGAA